MRESASMPGKSPKPVHQAVEVAFRLAVGEPLETRFRHAGRHGADQLHEAAARALPEDERMLLATGRVRFLVAVAGRLRTEVEEHADSGPPGSSHTAWRRSPVYVSCFMWMRHRPDTLPSRMRSIAVLISLSGRVSVTSSRSLIRPAVKSSW